MLEPTAPPIDSEEPTEQPPSLTPEQPSEAPQTEQAMEEALTGGFDVANSSQFFSPNMFGDQFGMSGVGMSVPIDRLAISGSEFFADFSSTFVGSLPVTVINAGGSFPTNAGIYSGIDDASQAGGGTLIVSLDRAEFTTVDTLDTINGQITGPDQIVGIVQSPSDQVAVLQQTFLDRNGVTGVVTFLPNNSGASASSNFWSFSNNFSYAAVYDYVIAIQTVSPTDGGTVGRTKISDDNSPLPRDRFIFNYDYFNNVPLVPTGWDVHRFSPGIEKTFFNQMTSVEVRMPFASTLDSDFTQGSESNNVELGNLHFTFKGLVYASQRYAMACGLGVDLPTADDTRVGLNQGQDLVRIENRAVLLTPYVAGLYTPNQRFFGQWWVQMPIDANGNPVYLNANGQGLAMIGRHTSQSVLQLDGQIGYWLWRNNNPSPLGLAGIAPFVELHYNTTLGDPDVVTSQNFVVGSLVGNIDELNLSAGVIAQIGVNSLASLGVVAPLKDEDDRMFDYQIGLRVNHFFGPTARDRNSIFRLSTF